MQTTYEQSPDVGVAGMTKGHCEIKSMYNGEATTKITFGLAVKRGSATDGRNAKAMAANTDVPMGILTNSQAYENGPNGDLTTTGVGAGANMNVIRKGYVLVYCEDGCAPGDRLWVRGSGGTAGALRSTDAGGSTCYDATGKGEWQDYALAAGFSWLLVDFVNK